MNPTQIALTRFVDAYVARFPQLYDPFDESWRSPCELEAPVMASSGERIVRWQPTRRQVADDFAGVERALEITVHADVRSYYGSYWSGGLEATASEGHVSLLLLWNTEDADRLQENLIGHAIAKQRARAPFTVFFACTEPDSDLFLAVDNATGRVVLEKPGHKPIREVAPSLAAFLDRLTPAPPDLHPARGMLSTLG